VSFLPDKIISKCLIPRRKKGMVRIAYAARHKKLSSTEYNYNPHQARCRDES
jgi:hypothetical protein